MLWRDEEGQDEGTRFRVCAVCNCRPSLLKVPINLWHLILSFCDDATWRQTRLLCRPTQLRVPLSLPFGESWDTFFTEGALIATGATGSVYRTMLREGAPNPRYHNAPVAVKVLQKGDVHSRRKWQIIQREIDSLRICSHPHVVELVSVLQTPTEVYVVMQNAEGGDLFDWLVNKKAPSEAEVIPVVRQLLQTLGYMHDSCGVVHRDIKPENILLKRAVKTNEVPHILLADFGYARTFAEGTNTFPKRTESGSIGTSSNFRSRNDGNSHMAVPVTNGTPRLAHEEVPIAATPCGTLGFAAPEILMVSSERTKSDNSSSVAADGAKKRPATTPRDAPAYTSAELMKRMDIFAAGVTLCILLTGYEPFPCQSTKVHLEAVRNGVNFEGPHWAQVSAGMKTLLRRMLAPNAIDRPTALECLQFPCFSINGMGSDSQIVNLS
ncbi:putative protein kinase [Trypanosoma grayi]|uniref:putative protein kinase n=1 Tax=Trypanosoma grayi TaxID=71804 RepID=UPI0004F4854E|nr:putative protein kinase [Trypanosoma grayi]KEG13091.1 putative protein kinase [Trypanosoma grayi]